MKRLREILDRLVPAYARGPLLAVLLFNFIAYYIPKALENGRELHLLSTAFDNALPRVPCFIYIYVLAYLQWVFSYVVIARDSRERCFRFVSGELIAKAITMAILLIWPTTMVRPPVEITGPTTWLLDFIYRADTPTNLFPSLHCLASWLCFRWSLGLNRMPRWYGWAQGAFSLLVFASVVLVKQHVWPDILGGVAAAELGILLSRILRADRLAAKLDLSRIGGSPRA